MSGESAVETGETPVAERKSKLPLLVGIALSLLLGAAGFYAGYAGLVGEVISASTNDDAASGGHGAGAEAEVAFVPIQPILVSLPGEETPRHLRFRAELETVPSQQKAVEQIMPRILDVLNGYLRAVSMEDLERPTALIRLRAQMLRRVQLVAGDREIRDLLVTEFVLN